MENQEQQIQERIEIIIGNVLHAAQELAEMVSVAGNEKMDIKGHQVSLLDLIDPTKMDIVSFIAFLKLSKQYDKVFFELPYDVVNTICVDMYGEALTEELKNIFN